MTKVADEELYLIVRDGTYYVHGTIAGRRVRKSCQTKDHKRALEFLEAEGRIQLSGWREDYDSPDRDWQSVAQITWERHKFSARRRGIPFDLKPANIYLLMKEAGFRCAVSGVPFAKSAVQDGKRDPWAPSVDRIENRHGYMVDNVRVVCLAANIAMNDWGQDILLRLARGVVRCAGTTSPELTQNLNITNENLAQVIDINTKS